MTKKEKMLLVAQICHEMPSGHRFQDTGAPRGERNHYSIVRGEVEVYGSFSLRMILKCVRGLRPRGEA